jgi:uncharacterized integral membrane protein
LSTAIQSSVQDKKSKSLFWLLLIGWFLLNLIQAIFTEINADEAYYVLYGKNLAWGYFDHPPLVGVITFLGGLFFKGNLGARFFTVLLQPITLWIVWKIINPKKANSKNTLLFFIISASLVMFSAYGFITTPDVPLLFFTALFLYAYKSFLKKEDLASSLFVSICMAGLVYSKYQGGILIVLVVFSNWRLLKSGWFWLAGILALVLCAPHFYWQYSNEFPSFRYHLIDRSSGFKWDYFFEYIPTQIAIFNPLTFGALIYVFIKKKEVNKFELSLYFIIIGFISFFALTTFRGHAEPHWTVAASIPMIILISEFAFDNERISKYIKKWVPLSLVLLAAARILLMSPLLPDNTDFSGKEKRIKAIESIAGNSPVVFSGSFQNPSVYAFFTGKESTVVSSLQSRQTQFDLWKKELQMKGEPVFIAVEAKGLSKKYKINGQEFDGFFSKDLQTTNSIAIKYQLLKKNFKSGDTIELPAVISNPTSLVFKMNHPEFPATLKAVFIKDKQTTLQNIRTEITIDSLPANGIQKNKLYFVVPALDKGNYLFGLSFESIFGTTINSSFEKINCN